MMFASIKKFAFLSMMATLLGLAGCATTAESGATAKATDPIKAVYHINNSQVAFAAMRNAQNHMNADPGVKITFVTHGMGIDFLLDGATDKNGNPYNVMVEELMAKGVDFRVCNNTLVSRKIDPKKVIQGAVIVPSGVAELGKLQSTEGYVYIKP